MRIFADTSGLYALFDADNIGYEATAKAWDKLRDQDADISTTNYIVLESFTLLQRRLGISVTRQFIEDIMPLLHVEWVDPDIHAAGLASVLTANRRDLSLVDCTSFELMRRLGITHAFTLDEHFHEQGFEVLP